jgi:hypothetical protein
LSIRAARPAKGSPERREWVLNSIRSTFAALGLPRTAFTIRRWQEARGEVAPCNDDIASLGGWAAACVAALGELPVPVAPIPAGHRLRGVSTLVGADGAVKQQWVKTREEEVDREEVLARLMETLPERVRARDGCVPAPSGPARDDLLAVYVAGDPHIGMRSSKEETGADFDLKIVERLMIGAVRDLVLRGPRTTRAMVAILGDTLHFDNLSHHTTKGEHALDVDGRTAKVLRTCMLILTSMIDAALEHHDEVLVDCQAGNHDSYSALMIAIGLDAYYRNEPRCKVSLDPAMRHYYTFGRVLIGTVHGDKTKADDLESIMAAERPREWGETEHRYWLCGHVHHLSAKEYRGCKVETFRTLAARDAWHAGAGYMSKRDMTRIVYHRRFGEVSREVVNVGMLDEAA